MVNLEPWVGLVILMDPCYRQDTAPGFMDRIGIDMESQGRGGRSLVQIGQGEGGIRVKNQLDNYKLGSYDYYLIMVSG